MFICHETNGHQPMLTDFHCDTIKTYNSHPLTAAHKESKLTLIMHLPRLVSKLNIFGAIHEKSLVLMQKYCQPYKPLTPRLIWSTQKNARKYIKTTHLCRFTTLKRETGRRRGTRRSYKNNKKQFDTMVYGGLVTSG